VNAQQTIDCYHCGLPIDGEPKWFVTIDGESQAMCCPGCQAVSETILLGGLANYYKYRTEMASQADSQSLQDSDYSLYDDPAFQAQWVDDVTTDVSESLKECRLIIGDIHCAACVWLLENRLTQLSGVEQVNISLSDHSALIQWHDDKLNVSDIFKAINEIGYSAQPYSPNSQQQSQEQANSLALRRLGVAGIGMMQSGMFSIALYAGDFQGIALEHQQFMRWVSLIIVSVVMMFCTVPFFAGAKRALRQRSLNMDVPISIALLAAYGASTYSTLIGHGEVYFDSITMFCFFLLVARYLEQRARQSQRLLSHQAILPTTCRRLMDDGSLQQLAITAIGAGDKIVIRPGETISVDGIIADGSSAIDESSFTGEFMPVRRNPGDAVMAGTINTDGSLTVTVTATGNNTNFSAIEKLLSKAQTVKPKTTLLSELVSRYFTGVVLAATAIAGLYWYQTEPAQAFAICLAMLVVSCPCALSLATPTALTISALSLRQAGLLISKNHVLEQADSIDTVCFDKTGTISCGELTIEQTDCFSDLQESQCLAIAAALERFSEHPIAKAFQQKNVAAASQLDVHTGKGIEATVDNTRYRLGSYAYCQEWLDGDSISCSDQQSVYLIDSNQWLARFQLNDKIRTDAASTISALNNAGLYTVLLTGDSSQHAIDTAKALAFKQCQHQCSPEDKLQFIQRQREQGSKLLMVGDGINDIPVLAAADISIAMNGASDMAKVQADSALLSEKLSLIPLLFSQARKTRRIIKQNLFWALLYNGSALPLAAIGLIPPYLAALGMSLSSLLVILNARRLRKPVQLYLAEQH
jgi:Cu2+-exporting ATPase